MITIRSIDKLCRYPYFFSCLPYTAFQYSCYSQFHPDLSYIFVLPFKRKRRSAGSNPDPFHSCQCIQYLFRHPIAEILILRVIAHINKRKNGNALFLAGLCTQLCGAGYLQPVIGNSVYINLLFYIF